MKLPLVLVGVAACVGVYLYHNKEQNAATPLKTLPYTEISRDEQMFIKFIAQHGRSYATKEEYEFRLQQFRQSLAIIAINNGRNDITYKLGVNKFADWTQEEYQKLLGFRPTPKERKNYKFQERRLSQSVDSIDWRSVGVVNDIKDQGQCGSCWAFSAVAAMESAHAIKNQQKPVSLSEQQLVDCSTSYGNAGCCGGWMDQAFQYAIDNGMETEDSYPYKAEDGQCTHTADSKSVVTPTGFIDIPENDADQIKSAVQDGPVSVAIRAQSQAIQYYTGGIINDPSCGTDIDHAVVIVGYGNDSGQEYWIVRNSWGTNWGVNGYVFIANNGGQDAGICGINKSASYPTI